MTFAYLNKTLFGNDKNTYAFDNITPEDTLSNINMASDGEEDFNDAKSQLTAIPTGQKQIQDEVLGQEQYLGEKEKEKEDPKKIDVDEKKLAKTPFDSVIEAKQWKGLEVNRHMGIVGATTAGKTTFFKTMLADQKIPICDVYIVVGDSPGKSEIITGFCTLEYLTNHSYANKNYMHFNTSELEKAFAYCLADENNNITKCLFLSDILISSAKVKDRTANFMNRAKNFKTSVIVEIHHLAGESMVLMRNALAVIVYLDQQPKALARALDMSVVDNVISKYGGLSKFDKVLIHDKQEGIFNKDYLPF